VVAKRDQRKDGFVQVIKKAMTTKLGEEVLKSLTQNGIPRSAAKRRCKWQQDDEGDFVVCTRPHEPAVAYPLRLRDVTKSISAAVRLARKSGPGASRREAD
jgi:hypothetical protein